MSLTKVLIPLATSAFAEDPSIAIDSIRHVYLKKLLRYGLTPVLLSPLLPLEMADQLYAECSGVLFTGGKDIHPDLYGATQHPKMQLERRDREELEFHLLSAVLSDRKPFVGMCRGCQVLAVAGGGDLHQWLPDLELNEEHGTNVYWYRQLLDSKQHSLVVDRESKFFALTQRERLNLNSGHRQAVKSVGPGFRVAARSPAGIVEIIEHSDPNFFCYGFQGHPEAFDDGPYEVVFREFARAVREWAVAA